MNKERIIVSKKSNVRNCQLIGGRVHGSFGCQVAYLGNRNDADWESHVSSVRNVFIQSLVEKGAKDLPFSTGSLTNRY